MLTSIEEQKFYPYKCQILKFLSFLVKKNLIELGQKLTLVKFWMTPYITVDQKYAPPILTLSY